MKQFNRGRVPRYYSWEEVPVLMDCIMAGQLLGITPDYVSMLCRKGTLEAVKLGKNWLIRKDVIQKMVGIE